MSTVAPPEDDLKFTMQIRRRIQGIFQVNDTVVFLLNLALQLANSQDDLEDIDALSMKYELSVENAVKLSLAARLLKDTIPESLLDRPGAAPPVPEVPSETSSSTLYVRNIPAHTPEHEIVGVFQNFGTIKEVRMQRDKQTGQFFGYVVLFLFSCSYLFLVLGLEKLRNQFPPFSLLRSNSFRSAFVEYVNSSAAKLAYIQVNQKLWGSNTIHVDFAKERNPGMEGGRREPAPSATSMASALGHEVPPSSSGDDKEGPVSPTLFVAGLPLDIDRGSLYSLFARFGKHIFFSPFSRFLHSLSSPTSLLTSTEGSVLLLLAWLPNPSQDPSSM
jgi:RNA recognition motif-containing protein